MNFNFSEEQLAIQETLKRFIGKDYKFERRRELVGSKEGFSREVWTQFADFGILGQTFPDAFGGLGGTAVDTMIVMDSLGRGLVLEPYLSTVTLAGSVIRDAGSERQKSELLPAIADGKLLMALAHHEPGARYELNHVATRARADGSGYRISGRKSLVLGGGSADFLLCSARTDGRDRDGDGISLFLIGRDTGGLAIQSYSTHDDRRAAEISLDEVHVPDSAIVGPKGCALRIVEKAIDYAIAALCSEAVGIMSALNEATLEYLKTRRQFGQPIGRFQALQHRMVDMVIATEQARSICTLASIKVDSPDANERRRAVSAAKVYVGQAARLVGQGAVQLHGGMGVVDELMVGHYFKRLSLINASFGDPDHHLGSFGDMLLAA